MRIGQLAAQTGFSVRTIRFYEQIGILPTPERTPGGYRSYDQVLTVVDLADGGVVHDADDGVVEMPRPLVADGAVVGLVPGCSAW